jgi:hypothetical protein
MPVDLRAVEAVELAFAGALREAAPGLQQALDPSRAFVRIGVERRDTRSVRAEARTIVHAGEPLDLTSPRLRVEPFDVALLAHSSGVASVRARTTVADQIPRLVACGFVRLTTAQITAPRDDDLRRDNAMRRMFVSRSSLLKPSPWTVRADHVAVDSVTGRPRSSRDASTPPIVDFPAC